MERGLIPNTAFVDPTLRWVGWGFARGSVPLPGLGWSPEIYFFWNDILSSASAKSDISNFLQLLQFGIYVLSLQLFWYFVFSSVSAIWYLHSVSAKKNWVIFCLPLLQNLVFWLSFSFCNLVFMFCLCNCFGILSTAICVVF